MRVLVTGCAGFIGSHVTLALLQSGRCVIGLDNLNHYYDVRLKKDRLKRLYRPNFCFVKGELANWRFIGQLFERWEPEIVIHLAAQAGVRYSLEKPQAYIESNVTGFMNILEACRYYPVRHLIYASTSSVYGLNGNMPYATRHSTEHPVSLYAATKKANELMAHTYSHLFGLPTTGLRFFTVYGPWGRPDMALHLFTESILAGRPINIYNFGEMNRDFTYIDDVVDGILRLIPLKPSPDPAWSKAEPNPGSSPAPFKLYNIGNSQPVRLLDCIAALERKLGVVADKRLLPLQPGDVTDTCADVSELVRDTGFKPDTSIETGIGKYVEWYKSYYGGAGGLSGLGGAARGVGGDGR